MRGATPVLSPEDQERILEQFVSAASLVLREWASTEVGVRSVGLESRGRPFGDVSAVLEFLSGPFSALVISSTADAAAALARRILAEVTPEVDDALIHDCLGEVANLIAGQAQALLVGTPYHFTFSTPRIVSGAAHDDGQRSARDSLVAVLVCDLGEIALQVDLTR